MSKTLLEIVQDILSSIDGDEVNSITDTSEAEQIARIVRQSYNDIMSRTNWPSSRRAVALTPRSDSNFPTHMILNENVKELISIFYNMADLGDTRREYREIKYLDPDDFLRKINVRNNDEATVDIVADDSGIELLIQNNKDPEYYTSFNDTDLVFDSYDAQVDSTLQEGKFQAQAFIIPAFNLTDSFVPDLPVDAFSFLEEEATSRAQFKLRQIQDVKSEQSSLKNSRRLSRKAWRTNGGIRYPDYGRK